MTARGPRRRPVRPARRRCPPAGRGAGIGTCSERCDRARAVSYGWGRGRRADRVHPAHRAVTVPLRHGPRVSAVRASRCDRRPCRSPAPGSRAIRGGRVPPSDRTLRQPSESTRPRPSAGALVAPASPGARPAAAALRSSAVQSWQPPGSGVSLRSSRRPHSPRRTSRVPRRPVAMSENPRTTLARGIVATLTVALLAGGAGSAAADDTGGGATRDARCCSRGRRAVASSSCSRS